jgi:gamma-glutamyltranspeptidase/glutathione hydrolase
VGRRSEGRARLTTIVALGSTLAIAGCGTIAAVKKTIVGGPLAPGEHLKGFIGGVVADEPLAALAAREVLATGGTAADAAVTLGFMLSVTLPSRASLGSGGACIAYKPGARSPAGGVPEAVMFVPRAPATNAGDRPAAVPMLARGLYLLNYRYGSKPFEELLIAPRRAAAGGITVSRSLAQDFALVQAPLLQDPAAAAIFAPGGRVLTEGQTLVQRDLAGSLTQIAVAGVGDAYQGLLAQRLIQASDAAGGPITLGDLRQSVAVLANPIVVKAGADQAAFLPPPADGGLGAAAAFISLQQTAQVSQSLANLSVAVPAEWRAHGGDPLALLQAGTASGTLPALPASTSFAVIDRKGEAIACALTMDNLFGTGRVAAGTGIVLGASPAIKPLPLLTAAVAWSSQRDAFRAAIGASGQNGAALAGAVALASALAGDVPPHVPVPDPGRANIIACPSYLPGGENTCRAAADPRGAGLAAGSE